MRPLADRLVIKPLPPDEKTKGGIILPDIAKDSFIGQVVAVGPGKTAEDGKKISPEVGVGDRVLYGKYSGTAVTIDGEEFLVMREVDVFAVV